MGRCCVETVYVNVNFYCVLESAECFSFKGKQSIYLAALTVGRYGIAYLGAGREQSAFIGTDPECASYLSNGRAISRIF